VPSLGILTQEAKHHGTFSQSIQQQQQQQQSPHIPQRADPGHPAWFRDELWNGANWHQLKHFLAAVLISQATGMLFSTVADILGYDSAGCARILISLPSLLEYNSEEQIITFHHGQKLLEYVSSPGSGVYQVDIQVYSIQMIIRMVSSYSSYKGSVTFLLICMQL
jgi:hypothetical protein